MVERQLKKDVRIKCYTTMRATKITQSGKDEGKQYDSLGLYLHVEEIDALIAALTVIKAGPLTGKAKLDIKTFKRDGDFGPFDSSYFFVKEVMPAKGVAPLDPKRAVAEGFTATTGSVGAPSTFTPAADVAEVAQAIKGKKGNG